MGAAAAIEALLRSARDDASVSDAARRALGLDEALGRLPDLAEALAADTDGGTATPARRRALVDVLERLLPALYRDPLADEARARLGRVALRPLLDLVVASDVPDRRVVDLLGMLGNADAAPALARIAGRGAVEGGRAGDPRGAAASAEARAAALVALGRLGDPRGLAPLAAAATGSPVTTRAAAVWALGRIAGARVPAGVAASVAAILWHALEDPRPEVVALACLGLGRSADARTVVTLASLAGNAARPGEIRLAATLALGRAGGQQAVAALIELLDRGDAELSRGATMALGWTRDPRALPALLARALLPGAFALAGPEAPLTALGVWQAGGAPPDEARAIAGNDLAVRAVLAALLEAPPPGDLTPLWRAHTGELDAILADALSRGGSARRAALDALDARTDGPGLGALAGPESAPSAPEAASAAREIAWPLADQIAAALDDPDRRSRAAALGVLAKLDDERVSPVRLADAVAQGAPQLADAAVAAARILVRAHPALAAPIAAAIAPLLADDDSRTSAVSWGGRLSAVELLAVLGAPGLPLLDRATRDRSPLVRAAALEALSRARGSGAQSPHG